MTATCGSIESSYTPIELGITMSGESVSVCVWGGEIDVMLFCRSEFLFWVLFGLILNSYSEFLFLLEIPNKTWEPGDPNSFENTSVGIVDVLELLWRSWLLYSNDPSIIRLDSTRGRNTTDKQNSLSGKSLGSVTLEFVRQIVLCWCAFMLGVVVLLWRVPVVLREDDVIVQ